MICVQTMADGSLKTINFNPSVDSSPTCDGYVLVQSSDVTLNSTQPDSAIVAAFFALGLSLVVGCYLSAYGMGAILNVVRSR